VTRGTWAGDGRSSAAGPPLCLARTEGLGIVTLVRCVPYDLPGSLPAGSQASVGHAACPNSSNAVINIVDGPAHVSTAVSCAVIGAARTTHSSSRIRGTAGPGRHQHPRAGPGTRRGVELSADLMSDYRSLRYQPAPSANPSRDIGRGQGPGVILIGRHTAWLAGARSAALVRSCLGGRVFAVGVSTGSRAVWSGVLADGLAGQ
jgi:hypothetical protein